MLDTNICAYIMRQRPRAVLERLQLAARHAEIVISVITFYEMRLGALGPKAAPHHAQLVEDFCARLAAILPWDREAADQAAHLRADLGRRGTPIGPNDTMIAGHALARGCVLVTNNLREFLRVDGLAVEDWSAA